MSMAASRWPRFGIIPGYTYQTLFASQPPSNYALQASPNKYVFEEKIVGPFFCAKFSTERFVQWQTNKKHQELKAPIMNVGNALINHQICLGKSSGKCAKQIM